MQNVLHTIIFHKFQKPDEWYISKRVENELALALHEQRRNDIVLLTRLAKHDLSQVCTHDVIVRVCVYVGGAITGSCADTHVA